MRNNLSKKLLPFVFLLAGSVMYGQRTVKGVVSDSSGSLPGVTVQEKGTSNGTQTDLDGNYTITVSSDSSTLVFSYLGYKTQEVAVDSRDTINVTLEEDSTQLDEIVVIGYGKTTVKDATGSVASVTSENFNKGVVASPEQLIQGKTAGVQITQSSGEPGAGINIRIRGTNSVRANNNPLFVVDGIPLAAGNNSSGIDVAGVGSNPAKNPLSFLNPNDIESISILKDASATAIYGSRGANGVVIITTKSGRGKKGVLEYEATVSSSRPYKTYDLLDRAKYIQYSEELGFNVGERDFGGNTDWQDVIFRTVLSNNQNLSYTKSHDNGNVRASVSYSNQQGVVQKSQLERLNFRINTQQRFFKDKLKLSFQGTYSDVEDNSPPIAGTAGFRGDLIGAAYAANPTWPSDPSFDNTGGLINPSNLLENTSVQTLTDRLLVSFSAEYSLSESLTAKVNLGYDYSDADTRSLSSGNLSGLDGVSGNGRGSFNKFEFSNTLSDVLLNYKKKFGNIEVDALLGFSYQKFDRRGTLAQAWGFSRTNLDHMSESIVNSTNLLMSQIDGSYQQFGYGTGFQTDLPVTGNVFVNRLNYGNIDNPNSTDFLSLNQGSVRSLAVDSFDNFDELQSYFARINLVINNTFLFTGTLRADGSTSFGSGNQYGYFPSGAIAWKLNQEDFIGENVSTLKLRLNAGVTGNQEGLGYGNAVRRERFNGVGIANNGEITIPQTGVVAFENPDLKWESVVQYGFGVDFGFNQDRFSGTVDFYKKETRDILFQVFSAQPANQPFRFENLPNSRIVNSGIELALAYDFIQKQDLNWNVSFNVAYNDNMVKSLNGEFISGAINGQGLTGAFSQNLKEGYPQFSWYIRDFQGFDSDGQPIYTNNGDPVFVGKSALPTVTGGLSTSLNYKNWSLNAYFNGQFGHYLYHATENAFFTAGSFASGRNVIGETLTSGESLNAAADPSTRFLEKGDFIRLQNLSVSYDVPLKNKTTFQSFRLSLTGQNLLLITNYSGLDPEVNSRTDSGLPTLGIDYGAFPNPRIITFGINAKF